MRSTTAALAYALAACVVGGCTVGPNYVAPHAKLPAAFDLPPPGTPTTAPASQPATAATEPPVDLAHWWQSLHDPELDSLVSRAISSNLDVRVALARFQEARASANVVSGGTLPYLEGSLGAGRGTGNNSTKGRIASPLNSAANTAGLKEITEVMGFDSGWEIDLFGRFRRELEVAQADTQAAGEVRNAVLISLIAEVARVYMDLRAAQLRLAIAQQGIATGQQTLNVVQQRFDRGLTNELDVVLARRQVASESATVPPLQDQIKQAQHRLAVLLGQSPESLNDELQTTANLPDPSARTITGLPVDLLQRRPDIRQAERLLAAENARIGVATADLFPRLVITAGLGLQGQGLGRVPATDSLIWSAGPSLAVPLLDFGRVDSVIMLEDLRTQELYYDYQKTVLHAVEEVDDAVGGYASQRDRLDQLSAAVDASKRAVTLASGRYDTGLIDFLNVLDAQRQLYTLEDQYTVAQQAVAVQYIALYKALGGGWESFQRVPQLRVPLPAVIAAGARVLGQQPAPEASPAADHLPSQP